MKFDMRTLGFLMLLTVGSRASINKLFFLGPNVEIICPLDATFYQWKKYHNQKMTNIFQDDKRKINISLNLEESPTTYECGATSGFENRNVNITVYVLDRNSKKSQELCYLEPIGPNSMTKHRVQYPCFLHYQNKIANKIPKGSSVTLDCEASGTNVSYMWFKLNTPTSHKDFLIGYNNSHTVDISNFNDKSVGRYLCVVNTDSGKKLERVFDLFMSGDHLTGSALISIENPETINITAKLYKNQKLDCTTKIPIKERIQAIQWGKKLEIMIHGFDKTQVISWEGNYYKLLPESQIIGGNTEADPRIISSYIFKDTSTENSGEYICVIVTNSGLIKYKSFFVTVSANGADEETQRSFFFLYILIPSLIIAVCLFIGIYLTVNRRPARKASNFVTGVKSENDSSRLRTTPDYSSVQYQTKPPPNQQYPPNHNYYNPYYPSSDKLIV